MPQLQICESAHHTMYGSIEKNMRELVKLRGIRALVHNARETQSCSYKNLYQSCGSTEISCKYTDNSCTTTMEEVDVFRHVMDTPDHHKFFELLLRPRSAYVNTRFLENSDVRKLACVSRTMRKIVPAGELENNQQWKENGENVFGLVFTELCNICLQAGYNPTTLPGFYMNVNEILSGKYLEEVELDTVDCSSTSHVAHSVRNITASMLGLRLGRSRDNDLSCLADPSMSRQLALIHRHTGTLVYRNLSTAVDSWKRSTGGSAFVIMPRATPRGVTTNSVLQIGDYVTITTGNLSTLRVNLAATDVERLLQLMHSTKCRDDRDHGPHTLEEAQCELELARARVHRQAHDDFFAQRAINNSRVGASAVDLEAQRQKDNKKHLDAKILRMDQDVQRLEQKLMRLRQHHKDNLARPTKRQTMTLENEIGSLQAQIHGLIHTGGVDANLVHTTKGHAMTRVNEIGSLQARIHELTSNAIIYARTIQEQKVRLENHDIQAQCAICFEKRTSNFIFEPCSHVCCCDVCAHKMVGKPCPLCRQRILRTSPVYMT